MTGWLGATASRSCTLTVATMPSKGARMTSSSAWRCSSRATASCRARSWRRLLSSNSSVSLELAGLPRVLQVQPRHLDVVLGPLVVGTVQQSLVEELLSALEGALGGPEAH